MRRLLATLLAGICWAQAALAEPLIRDAEIEHTLRQMGDPVFKVAGLKPSAVKIFIVQADTLNAYVAGGSNIFIHTGLIMQMDTPDMLIGVMAHETGHIAGGHLAKGTEKLKDAQLGTILTFVLGAATAAATKRPDAAAAVIAGGQTTATRNILAFTRSNEESADQAAFKFLDQLGISTSGMVKMFNLLQRNERLHSSNPDPYLLTHPLSGSRIENARSHTENAKIPEGQYPQSLGLPHKRMVAKLYGFLNSPEQTLARYPLSDKSVPARLARAVAYYKMPDLARALAEIDSLIEEAGNDPFLYDLKGQILFENGRVEEALAAYGQAGKLLPDSALILTDLGKVELSLPGNGHVQSAIGHLEKASHIEWANSATWRLLATAYGKSGNTGMASLALAEEASLGGDDDAALKHVEYAITLLKPGTPAYLRAQDVKSRSLQLKKNKDDEAKPF